MVNYNFFKIGNNSASHEYEHYHNHDEKVLKKIEGVP